MHGVSHLGRASAAEKLRMADAAAAPHQKPEHWRQWVNDLKTITGG